MKFSVCGKGGSGKSTVVALLASEARRKGLRVLVVDSDESNSGLFRLLGFPHPPVPLMEMLGGKKGLKKRMGKKNILAEEEIRLDGIPSPYLVEKDGLGLVAIGKILQALEGCACPMGALSREFLKKLRLRKGEIAFVDMEAGVEHFGRGVEEGIDGVLLVVEPSLESMTLAERVKELASGVGKPIWAVLNKVSSQKIEERLKEILQGKGIEVIGVIPHDEEVFEASLEGRPIERGKAAEGISRVLERLMGGFSDAAPRRAVGAARGR